MANLIGSLSRDIGQYPEMEMENNRCSHGKTLNTDPCYFYKDILYLLLRLGHLADAFIQSDLHRLILELSSD